MILEVSNILNYLLLLEFRIGNLQSWIIYFFIPARSSILTKLSVSLSLTHKYSLKHILSLCLSQVTWITSKDAEICTSEE